MRGFTAQTSFASRRNDARAEGRKFVITTSACSSSRSSTARPSVDRRSSARPRLLRFICSQRKLKSPVSATSPAPCTWRSGSPVTRSTFTTSAPQSASTAPQLGTKPNSASSTTFTPSSTAMVPPRVFSAPQRGDLGRVGLLERAVDQPRHHRAHRLEALTERLAHPVSRVDAFDDDGKLVGREALVPVHLVDGSAAHPCVALDDLIARQE